MGDKRQSSLNLTPIMWAYVEQARATGLYGDSTSGVLRELVLSSLRRALESGLLTPVKP
jgi:hypothetical protein